MTLNLPAMIYDRMVEMNAEAQSQRIPTQHWHPSGIGIDVDGQHGGKCRRALYYDLTFAEKTNPMDAPALFKCDVGNLIHDYLDKALEHELERLGWKSLGSEVPVVWKVDGLDFPFSGRFDYLFETAEGKKVVVEWKSTYGRGFDSIKKQGAKIENLLQCACYLSQTVYQVDEILLMYAGRDSGYLLGFSVTKTDDGLSIERMGSSEVNFCPIKFDHIVESCRVVERCIKEGFVPKKDFQEKDWQCSYCSYHDRCKED